ncbi:hypothetical protein LguiA_002951 [Lonicera macranthoides]
MKTTDFEVFITSSENYYEMYRLSALVQWKGKLLEYRSTLRLLKCINLSSNKLVGQIPQELASLAGLCSLNLSRNNLTGHIIQNISQMKNLEILDLSRNHLSGAIPIDLGSLNFLSVLDLSINNFSGKIPLSTQLQTFNASVYAGNDKLCGVPLNECPEDESTLVCPFTDHGKGYTNEEDEDTFVTTGLYVSAVLGFILVESSLGKLQHLNLSQSNFVGRVPHQLWNLTNLRSLHLGFNYNLTIENLDWLSDLHLLRHLDLSLIDLEKVNLLYSMNRLSFLSRLCLVGCNLRRIISPSLHLTNFSSIPLSIIHLSYNHFTNYSINNWLFNFSSSLIDVDMCGNPLGGSIPDAFRNMMSLESLSLSNCAFEGDILKSFKNLSRIQSLDLHLNNLTGQLPELFETLFASNNSLEILDLSENKFSGSLSDFTSFSSLKQLLVSSNKLNGSFPKHFGQSSPLEYLDLSKNELNGSLPDLTSFPLLRYLYLMNNKIQRRLPESIGELSNLKELCLSFNLLTLEFSSDWTPSSFSVGFYCTFKLHVGTSFPRMASISK